MIDKWIAEATECDFKVALEIKKPKSWLKSVSAFANGIGGTLIFGIDDNRNVVGLTDAQADAEAISRLIKERISPYPNFILVPERKDGKNILILTVSSGYSTPYYYKADGVMETYIRIGNESVIAPSFALNQLILKGMNRTYDTLNSEYAFKDYAFSKLRERYKVWTGNSMEDKLFDSFDIRNEYGKLTNAGALLADDSPIRHSRLFCTRWNGLDKSGGMVDALDSAEYSGSLIILLNEGVGFVKRNMKTRWKKTANSRIEMPDYCERSIFEALVNALIHRDYLILGSEVHIDIYDDHLTITSPGGMADGTRIQERDISNVSSTRRNPALADIFGRLGYMERQGSGFKKITETYRAAHNYRDELEPKFYSDASSFQVTLYNLNYGATVNATKAAIGDENVAIAPGHLAIEVAINKLNASQATIAKAKAVFANMDIDGVFGRSDIAVITDNSVTAAGNLITKLKNADLIEPVSGFGKGKYKFIYPKE
jgi:ATP-dependent DNA helicase RecG